MNITHNMVNNMVNNGSSHYEESADAILQNNDGAKKEQGYEK